MNKKDIEALQFIYDRMRIMYGENENSDYMRDLKRVIDEAGKKSGFGYWRY